MTSDDAPPAGDWKSNAFRWLFSQGASTVLLVAILVFLGYTFNNVYPEVEAKRAASEKQARDDFSAALKEQRTDFREAITQLGKSVEILADRIDKDRK